MKFFSSKRALAVLGALFLQAATALAGTVTITLQPVDTAVADATKLTLTVNATTTGMNSLRYVWKKGVPGNSVKLKEGSSNQFVIPSAKTTDAGTYFVTVEELGTPDFADSNVVTVTVNQRPKIIVQPAAPAIPPTAEHPGLNAVSFSVTLDPVFGVAPFTYQWQKKVGTGYVNVGVPVTKPDRNDTLTLNGVQLSSAGNYRVVVTNASGINVISKEVVLKVNSGPVITTQPAAASVITFGATGTLKVVVAGNAPFAYRWFKQAVGGGPFVAIPKATGASLTVKGTDNPAAGVAEGPGAYKVQIVNKFSLNYPADPKTTDPFSVATVTESDPFSVVTVIRKPKILTQPAKQTISILGGAVPHQLSVAMDMQGNPGTFLYQWYKDNKPILNATNSTLDFPALSWNDRGSYKVVIKNQVGSVTSAAAVITVVSPPIILTQSPAETYGTEKGTAKLFVTTTGTTPLIYEWRFLPVADGVGLTEAEIIDLLSPTPTPPAQPKAPIGKAASLSLSGLTSGKHHGYYLCSIRNAPKGFTPAPPVLSGLKYVQVDVAPKITQQTTVLPYNGSVTKGTPNIPVGAGNKLHLKISVSGTDRTMVDGNSKVNEMKFQWRKNGIAIVGAESSEYIVDPITSGETGKYTCEAYNLCGKVVSSSLSIVVSGPPSVDTQPIGASGIEESKIETTALKASGVGTLKYEWQKKSGADWNPTDPLQVGTKLVFAAATINDAATYRCRVYNVSGTTVFGETFTNEITISVSEIPLAVLGPVAGLSTRTFYPSVARAGEKVRIHGQNLQYTDKVYFGPGNTFPGTFVIESQNAILVTVPADAPTAGGPITVATKGKRSTSVGGGNTTTATSFRRTTDYENSRVTSPLVLPIEATILTLTQGTLSIDGNDSLLSVSDPTGRACYFLHVKKRSRLQVYLAGGFTPSGPVEMDLNVYMEDDPGANRFAGPDGVSFFPTTPQFRSFLIADDVVNFNTDQDDRYILIEAYSGFAVLGSVYVNFGPFSLFIAVQPLSSSSSDNGAEIVNLTPEGKWDASERGVTTTTEDETSGQTITFGGETATDSSEPVSLWQSDAGVNVTSGTVVSSFTMSLEPGAVDGDDQFAWQVSSPDGSPLMSLWVNAADGTLRVVQPDGTITTSAQHIAPGGGAHRFEITVNMDDNTWITLMDGVPVSAPIPISAEAGFGDVSAIWDLGADNAASGASIQFSNFRVEGVVAP